MSPVILSPSIIAADVGRLEEQVREAIGAGAEWIHIDVIDGHFAPNITIGPLVVDALKPVCNETGTLLDVHLMIENPDRYLEAFVDAGADNLTVHLEACRHLHRTVHRIRSLGPRAGVAINPSTPLSSLEEILPDLDLVLVMSVNPGFSFQKYIPASTDKIRRLRNMLNQIASRAHIEVDGGVNESNILEIVNAGADVVVAGGAVFGGARGIAENVKALRDALVLEA